MISSQHLQAYFYKGIDLSRHDQDIQYVDDDPSKRHIIVLIDTLHMVLLILFPDQEYQQGLILHLRKIIYKKTTIPIMDSSICGLVSLRSQ